MGNKDKSKNVSLQDGEINVDPILLAPLRQELQNLSDDIAIDRGAISNLNARASSGEGSESLKLLADELVRANEELVCLVGKTIVMTENLEARFVHADESVARTF